MLIALLTTDYPPLRSSAAVQMRDLARELVAQGHDPVVIVPTEGLATPWKLEAHRGVRILRLAAPGIRGGSNVRRAVMESVLPFAMLRGLRLSPLSNAAWDAVVWYSPSIFFGPLVWAMRRQRSFPTYLILRDIFPEWTVDLGLMRKGPAYWYFKLAAALQYAIADTIGIQSPSNAPYLARWGTKKRIEVLQNWLAPAPDTGCRLRIDGTPLAGRKTFVYIGNMGVAQAMDVFIDVAVMLRERADIGFLFVGRGTEYTRLAAAARGLSLDNVLFHGEIEPEEVSGLLAQCYVGLLSLDSRHKTHNVPGKFLSYMQAGLPVVARVNPGIDLAGLIERERVGAVHMGDSASDLREIVLRLADAPTERDAMSERARALSRKLFAPELAASQIAAAVSRSPGLSRAGLIT